MNANARSSVPWQPLALPEIDGVRHSWIESRGVSLHVAEAGVGRPVVCLHGWPQNFYAWRHLLADPPAGTRIIAPDLPGYGWSQPAAHRMAMEDIAADFLALLDVLDLGSDVLLVGHDWGGWIGFLLSLEAPDRFRGYLVLNMAHPWNTPSTAFPHALRVLPYQSVVVALGEPVHRRTPFVRTAIRAGMSDPSRVSARDLAVYGDSFKTAGAARAARNTYRTFWRQLPEMTRHPERRRLRVPTRLLFGTGDLAIHPSLADPATAIADDFKAEFVAGIGHFITDEAPELVRKKLLALDELTRA